MNIKKWWMRLVTGPHSASKVEVGTRVKYQGYEGTITGGTLHVKFDVKPSFLKDANGPNAKSASFNVSKNNIEVL